MGEFIEVEVYTQIARISKALANPVRLRLLDLMEKGEIEVERLADEAGIGIKNTSAQLQQLRNANLVVPRRQGNKIYYRLAGPDVSAMIASLETFAENRLADMRLAIANLLGNVDDLQPVTVTELSRRLDDPETMVIDIRSPQDYRHGHVPGALNLPAEDLLERLDSLPREIEIIAYCQGPYCVLSPDTVRTMRQHGLRARPLNGGITSWQRAGQRLDTDCSGTLDDEPAHRAWRPRT